MGILDKGIDIASFIGSAIFDPGGTSRGYKASKNLVDSAEPYYNELRDQITESTAFWINHRKLLGTDFMEHETREALLAKLMDRKRKTYEKTDYSYDPVAHKKELMDSGEFERVYNTYMDKYKKAEKYRLPSGLAYESPEFIEKTVAKYSNSTKQAFNKLAREVYNSYGIDKDLFALLGFGKGRDLSLIEIEGPEPDVSSDDYSFLMQEKDSPTKTALINKLTKEIEAGLVGYGKIDTEELALAMQKLESLYTPPRKRKSPGELDNNPRINGLVNDMIEGEFTPSVKEIKWGPKENTIDFTDWVNDLDDLSKSAFYKDLQQYASWITNVYDDAKLVPEGGTKHDEELLIVTLDYMIENDKFKSELGFPGSFWGIPDKFGMTSGYTPFTDNEKRKFFDTLPEFLNNLSGISLTDEQLEAVGNSIATIRANAKEEEKTGPKNKEQESDPPIVMVKKLIQGIGTLPPLTFESEKKKREQILELTTHWKKEGRDEQEIVEALFMLERIPVTDVGGIKEVTASVLSNLAIPFSLLGQNKKDEDKIEEDSVTPTFLNRAEEFVGDIPERTQIFFGRIGKGLQDWWKGETWWEDSKDKSYTFIEEKKEIFNKKFEEIVKDIEASEDKLDIIQESPRKGETSAARTKRLEREGLLNRNKKALVLLETEEEKEARKKLEQELLSSFKESFWRFYTTPIRAGESDYAKKRRLEREFAKSLRIEKRESSKTGGTVSLLDRDK